MKDKWADVHKVEQSTKFKSSDEILDEIAKQLLQLRDEGYDLPLPALPAPDDTEAERAKAASARDAGLSCQLPSSRGTAD
jgi:hypothetical protein